MDDKLQGVFVPVVTPFEDDEIRLDWLEENLEKLADTDVAGYLALGSNGEYKSLDADEAEKLGAHINYFVHNKHRAAYASYRRRGTPIGSARREFVPRRFFARQIF